MVDSEALKMLSDDELRVNYHKLINRRDKIGNLVARLKVMPMGLGEKWRRGQIIYYESVLSELDVEIELVMNEVRRREMVEL